MPRGTQSAASFSARTSPSLRAGWGKGWWVVEWEGKWVVVWQRDWQQPQGLSKAVACCFELAAQSVCSTI